MNKKVISKFKISKIMIYIICLNILFSMQISNGVIRVGDIVKIENLNSSWSASGWYLIDSSSKAKTATSGNSEWVLKRGGAADGTTITSGTFPKLMNYVTKNYLLSTGSPISMSSTSNYDLGEFWTPVDAQSNASATIDNLVNTFRSTSYPSQYTYVLYSGLGGQTSSYWPKNTSTINTNVDYNRIVAFVSNGGQILGSSSGNAKNVNTISANPLNLWYIRLVRTYAQEAFQNEFPSVNTPSTLNTLINKTQYLSNASNLIDYPNTSNSVYTKIQNFFSSGIPNVSGNELKALQTLLANSNLTKFLTTIEQGAVKTLQTNLNSMLAIGNTTFLFDTALYGSQAEKYAPTWVAPTPDFIVVKFKAQASMDIYVTFAATMNATEHIRLNIGGLSNTKTWMRYYKNDGSYQDINMISDSIPTTSTDFWIKMEGNILIYGRSATVGSGKIGSWTIPITTLKGFKYVGFGGYTSKIIYTNISITSLTGTNLTTAQNKYTFPIELEASTSPSNINTLINNTNYNSVNYLIDYPSTTNSVFTKIKSFFNSDNSLKNTITGQALLDLQTLLKDPSSTTGLNPKLKVFLSSSEQKTAIDWLFTVNNIIEINRVNSILSSLTNKTYDNQLSNLKNLVSGVESSDFIYNSIQNAFWIALTNLYTIRPTSDKTKLTTLKNWFIMLENSTTPLISSNKSLSSMINEINNNINKLDQVNTQSNEINRVNSILSALTSKTYDKQLYDLQALVSSTASSTLNYTSVQDVFWIALTNLYTIRPTSDKTKLTTLKNWFIMLESSTTPLISSDKSLSSMINNLSTNISKLITTTTATPSTQPTVANITQSATTGTSTSTKEIKRSFSAIFSNAEKPANLNIIINTPMYNSVGYLTNFPSEKNCIYTKIKFFFTNNLPNISNATELNDLKILLTNPNLDKFLTKKQKINLVPFTFNTELIFVNQKKSIKDRCLTLTKIINKYKKIKIPVTSSNYLFFKIMTPIYVTIMSYNNLRQHAQRAERDACVNLFTNITHSTLITYEQEVSTLKAIAFLKMKR